MQPKKYITPIKYREKAFGRERRENYTKEIMHNEPYFPKPLEYEDIDKEDNNDTSSMIITIATGLDRNDRIVIIGIIQIVLAITIGLLLSYKKKEKEPKE